MPGTQPGHQHVGIDDGAIESRALDDLSGGWWPPAAILIRALHPMPRLDLSCDQVRAAALRALTQQWLIGRRELTPRPLVAGVKNPRVGGRSLHDVARRAMRAGNRSVLGNHGLATTRPAANTCTATA